MKARNVLMAAALLVAAQAQAAVHSLESVTAFDPASNPMTVYPVGSFTDQLQFTVGEDFLATNYLVSPGQAVWLRLWDSQQPDVTITGVALYSAGTGNIYGGTWTANGGALALASAPASPSGTAYTSGPLAAGDYFFSVTGSVYGTGLFNLNAEYSIDAKEIAPVPEPGEWALMLGGLGLMGGVLRRRAARKA